MGGFLYFFPGIRNSGDVTPELLAECGLSNVFDKPGFDACHCASGPNGGPGVTTAPRDLGGPACQYARNEQTWTECADGKFWLGHYELPKPADLLRANPVDAFIVPLADKQLWTVPVARAHPGSLNCTLPTVTRLKSNGEHIHEIMGEFVPLMKLAQSVLPMLTQDEPEDPMLYWRVAVAALATNYRVTQWEVGALGILNPQFAKAVCWILCDMESHEKVIKARAEAAEKKDSASTRAG